MQDIKLRGTRDVWPRLLLDWSGQIAISIGATMIASTIQFDHPKTLDRVLVVPAQARSVDPAPEEGRFPEAGLPSLPAPVAAPLPRRIFESSEGRVVEAAAAVHPSEMAMSPALPGRQSGEIARTSNGRWRHPAHRRRAPGTTSVSPPDAAQIDRVTFSATARDPVTPLRVHPAVDLIPRTLSTAQAGLTAITTAGSSFFAHILD